MDLNQKNKWIILIASLLVIILIGVFVYFKFFHDNAKYFMVTQSIGGLVERDQVLIQGMEIGNVKSIVPHTKVNGFYMLELAIDKDIHFPDKSFGEIIHSQIDPQKWVIDISLIASNGYFEKNDTIPLNEIPADASSGTNISESTDTKSDNNIDEKVKSATKGNISFKIQFMISKDSISVTSSKFKGLAGVTFYHENGFYKYIVGNEHNIEDANKLCREVKGKGFKDAFVIAFKDGIRIPMNKAR